jgi:hypothetical protein
VTQAEQAANLVTTQRLDPATDGGVVADERVITGDL